MKSATFLNFCLQLSLLSFVHGGLFDYFKKGVEMVTSSLSRPAPESTSGQANNNHDFELIFPLRIKLSENGESDIYEVITLSKEECNLDSHSMKLSEVILKKSSNSEFQMDSQLFTSSGDEVHQCHDLDVYTQHELLLLEYSHGDKAQEAAIPRDHPEDHISGHVFHVPLGRLFLWPSYDLGHRAIASNVPLPSGYKPIVLETLSIEPRVFKIYNFFTEDETDFLIENALTITEDAYRLKRSSTGTNGYTVDTYRTSDNAFDTSSDVAMALKKRCFELLGMRPYNEHWADGLQILRYNTTTAYINHLDYIEAETDDHDWDSAAHGTNRFATILLYMSDVDDGGETFFPDAEEWFVSNETSPDFAVCEDSTVGNDSDSDGPKLKDCVSSVVQKGCQDPSQYGHIMQASDDDALAKAETSRYLDEKNISHLFRQNSWQRRMVQHCRSKMAVKPMKAQAVLFYSQKRLGEMDHASIHGGCPVLQGSKWAANLWVWNGPRQPYLKREKEYRNWKNDRTRGEYIPTDMTEDDLAADKAERDKAVKGLFRNIDLPPVEIYWQNHVSNIHD